MGYRYENPEDRGYKKIKMKRKEVNKLFKINPKIFGKYEVYENEEFYYIEVFIPLCNKIMVVILYPLFLLFFGVRRFKELNKEIYYMFNEKENGKFFSDFIRKE